MLRQFVLLVDEVGVHTLVLALCIIKFKFQREFWFMII
jgi:hypothetical protein